MAAMTEQKMKFCELYAFKEDLKLNHELIASELGISVKTVQRWLKEPDVIAEINKICASRLDRLIPTLTTNTEALLNSKSSTDKVKGLDSYWKLQEKMDRIQKGSEVSREQEIIKSTAMLTYEVFKDIYEPKEVIKEIIEGVGDYVINRKYEEVVTMKDIEKFLMEHRLSLIHI